MNKAEADEFVKTHKQAVLATIKKDGRPQLSNVLAVYKLGELWISIAETRAKYHNLKRDPRATLVLLGESFWQYLTVEGTARLAHMPDALPMLREYYELATGGPHENWQEYDDAMASERRVLAAISIEGMYPLTG
jgi:PPOX class probable F420-dependent enzyme